MQVIKLGTTSLPQDVIHEYISSLRQIYTPEVGVSPWRIQMDADSVLQSYDLFLHNCNNFSNDLAEFLVGRGIPDYITSLPQTVLNTPFGQMLKPQLDSAMRSMTQAPLPPSSAPAARAVRPSSTSNGVNGAHSGSGSRNSLPSGGVVRNVTDLGELERILNTASKKCAVIFFTSSTCAPCKIMYPAYDELAAEAGNKAVLIKVDIRHAYEIAAKHGVRATPTFMTFLHGVKENEWTGADESRLRGNVGLLLQMARHPHLNLHLPNVLGTSRRPLAYTKVPPLDKLINKMGDFGQDPAIQAVRDFVATRNTEGSREATLPDLKAFTSTVKRVLPQLQDDVSFTMVDLVRVAVVDPRVSGFYAEEDGHQMLATILDHANSGDRPYSLRLVTLQMLCNMFTLPLFATQTLQDSKILAGTIQVLTSNLPDGAHGNASIAAASLAYNLALSINKRRMDGQDDLISDADQLQALLSVVEGLSLGQASTEAFKRNLVAFGYLVCCARKDTEVLDYVKAADVASILREKIVESAEEKEFILEIANELLGKGLNLN